MATRRSKRTEVVDDRKPKLVFGQHIICPTCKGKGTKKSEICRECRGEGFVRTGGPSGQG